MTRVLMHFKILIVGLFVLKSFGSGLPDYYYKMKSGERQKREFIKIMLPLIKKSNHLIVVERQFVKKFFDEAIKTGFRDLPSKNLSKLLRLSRKYRIKNLFDRRQYLKRIDVVPVSLALAQASVESGWGKSRFVREANNIFGHWTYTGVGLIPAGREEGKTHRIRIFASLQRSVNAYMLNLNRNLAYQSFRDKRLKYRQEHKDFNGIAAAKTMLMYSQLREKYIKILVGLIRDENLLYYDAYKPAALMDSA
ncbi:glucosaminidase domain-containing protein [Sulfurospirillum sp. 1612]|uniref:glucosaminidase domain-containing protein n=1 Tax=Sulfurospirillum sp. 1612 TaxID=3094835 RepID=UPI002F93549A